MATSLLDWIMHLLSHPAAREHFEADPKAAMASAGMGSICGQDVRDAKAFLLDHPDVHKVREDGAPPSDHAHEHVRHIVKNFEIRPRHHEPREHERHSRIDHNDRAEHIDSHREFGVGPTDKGSTAADQNAGRIGHDQISLGGRGNLLGDGQDFSEHEWSHTDDHHEIEANDHGFHASVTGNGSAGHNLNDGRTAVSGNGAAGHNLNDDRTTVTGNGSAGHDIHAERVGPVLGQGIAGGDIDHTGGLAGLDHTVSVGNVNLLSNLIPGNLLNSSPILSGDLDSTLNGSLNHLNQGSLDDLVHNTSVKEVVHDIHNIHDILAIHNLLM